MRSIMKIGKMMLGICIMCFLLGGHVEAAVTIPASGDESGKTDFESITQGLKEDGAVVLESGSTYYIKGNLYVSSNQSITATGATIISQSGAFRNAPTKANYNSIKNFIVDGGTWKHTSGNGYEKSTVQLVHGKNITIKNATIYCNNTGHGIELIACKNVRIDNCVVKGLGNYSSTSVEEAVQIDIATPVTAPTVAATYGSKLTKGQTCQNITITNCTISGGRGVAANYASKEEQYKTKFHKNIVLKNNKITGLSSEGVALFNVIGATVEKNTIVSKSSRVSTAYSVGLHIAMFGKAPSGMKNAKYKVNNNTIKGGRQGFYVYSHSASKFGEVIAKKNKCYAKAGKEVAIKLDAGSIGKITLSGNKVH